MIEEVVIMLSVIKQASVLPSQGMRSQLSHAHKEARILLLVRWRHHFST